MVEKVDHQYLSQGTTVVMESIKALRYGWLSIRTAPDNHFQRRHLYFDSNFTCTLGLLQYPRRRLIVRPCMVAKGMILMRNHFENSLKYNKYWAADLP